MRVGGAGSVAAVDVSHWRTLVNLFQLLSISALEQFYRRVIPRAEQRLVSDKRGAVISRGGYFSDTHVDHNQSAIV